MGFWNLGDSKEVKAKRARKKRVTNEVRRQYTIGENKKKTELYRSQAELYEAKNRKKRAASHGGGEGIARKVKRGLRVSRRKPRWF